MRNRSLRWLSAPLALAVLAIAPAVAGATVTSSQITSVTTPDGFTANPAGNQLFSSWNDNANPSPTLVVAGVVSTDDANAADTVDVRCYYGDGGQYYTYFSGVTVKPDGTFDTSGTTSTFNEETCHMAAVDPAYSSPPDFTRFQGPVYGVGYREGYTTSGGPNDGTTYSYFSESHQLDGYMEWDSSGDCGMTWSQVFDSTFYDYDSYTPFDCAGALFTYGGGDGYGRSEIQVDGKNAFNSYGASNLQSYYDGSNYHYSPDNAGFPALSWTSSTDPATGDLAVTEREQLVRCGDTYPATAQCDPANPYTFTDAGVRFDRSIKQSKNGLQATVTDTYTSTDGAQHAIDVEYDNYSSEDDAIEYDVPGSAGFKPYYNGDTVELPAQAVGTIYVRDNEYGDGNPELQAPGAFTYLTQPDRMWFNAAGSSYGEFILQYRRTVPAGGSVSITHVYSQAADVAHVQALAHQAEDAAQPPTVSITSPANGAAISSDTVTVTGTAGDDQGPPALKVNGIPTAVGPDGGWSQQITLAPGSNTITAIATDKAGNTAQAASTVTHADQRCLVPNVTFQTLNSAQQGLVGSNCALGRVTTAASATVPAGSVISQGLAPGTRYPAGTPVDLVVSAKAKPATLVTRRTKLSKSGVVSVQLRCPAGVGVTNGTVKLRTLTSVHGRHRTLGTRGFQCPAGKKRTTRVLLSKGLARLLRRGPRNVRVEAFITSRNSSGSAVSSKGAFTLRTR